MNRSQTTFAIAWLVLVGLSLSAHNTAEMATTDPLVLPNDFQDWDHHVSANRLGHHDSYADPNGSRFVLGFRDGYVVTVKDDQRFAGSGGWGITGYSGSGVRRLVDPGKECGSCHHTSPSSPVSLTFPTPR